MLCLELQLIRTHSNRSYQALTADLDAVKSNFKIQTKAREEWYQSGSQLFTEEVGIMAEVEDGDETEKEEEEDMLVPV